MTETIQYPYTVKTLPCLGSCLPLVFFTITFNNLRYSFISGFILNWILIALADLIFLLLLIYILIKRLYARPEQSGRIGIKP